MVVDCGTAYLFYQSGEIGGGYIQFVGIEANLSFLAEVAIQMVEEDLIYFLLVPKVVGDAALLVRQFVDDEFEHVEHTLDHFHLINILVSHDVAHEVEDISLVKSVRSLTILSKPLSLSVEKCMGSLSLTSYSSVGVAAGVSRAADSRGTSVPRESAARSTVVARPSDVRSHPLWTYVDFPYRRTSTSPYVVHPYLLWMSYLPFLEAHF